MDSESPTAPTKDPQRITQVVSSHANTVGADDLSGVGDVGDQLPDDHDPWGEAGTASPQEEVLDDDTDAGA